MGIVIPSGLEDKNSLQRLTETDYFLTDYRKDELGTTIIDMKIERPNLPQLVRAEFSAKLHDL